MGRLVVQEFVTLDGYAADAEGGFTFTQHLSEPPEDLDQRQFEWLDGFDTMVLGARTYEMFRGFWPTDAANGEIIKDKLNALRRHVFSRTLTKAPWGGLGDCTVESGDLTASIQRIKAEAERGVVLWGSLSLARELIAAGAVDEVRLWVVPVAIGEGIGVFPAGERVFDLAEARPAGGGVVELVYTPRTPEA